MNLKRIFLTVTAAVLASSYASQAATVYVSTSASAPTYGDNTYAGQDGSLGNPFGNIMAAYHYLWTQSGTHEIRLLPGTYAGTAIGYNEANTYWGYLRLVSGNWFPLASPSWTSVTLTADSGPGTATIDYAFQLPSGNIGTKAHPAAFELEVTNPGGSNSANGGEVIRGLFNPGTTHAMTGMIIEDIDIVIAGGGVLIGTTASATGTMQQWTFNNVDLTLESDQTNDTFLGGDPWGRSALFVHHMSQTDLDNSYLDFNDSNIYVDPTPKYGTSGMLVGNTWAGADLPVGFVDGNNTSFLYFWDGSQYVLHADLQDDIWESQRNIQGDLVYANGSNVLQVNENGSTPYGAGYRNQFLVNFNSAAVEAPLIPEPSTMLLLLAGGPVLMWCRRRRRVM